MSDYKLLYPRQTVLVTCWDERNDRANIITLDWSMPTSIDPPLLAISVGITRYSHECIEACGEFVVNLPTEELEDAALFCGTRSGKNCNKFEESCLSQSPSKKVRVPGIGECPVRLECILEKSIRTGDHTIFVGRIVSVWKEECSSEKKLLVDLGGRVFAGIANANL